MKVSVTEQLEILSLQNLYFGLFYHLLCEALIEFNFYFSTKMKKVHITLTLNTLINEYCDTPYRAIENRILPKRSNDKINKHLKVIGKMINARFSLHHHIARHTCATTVLLENGVSLLEVKEWLGHTDISSTMIYAHVTPTQKMKTLEKLVA